MILTLAAFCSRRRTRQNRADQPEQLSFGLVFFFCAGICKSMGRNRPYPHAHKAVAAELSGYAGQLRCFGFCVILAG
jgi:hypothetical protein